MLNSNTDHNELRQLQNPKESEYRPERAAWLNSETLGQPLKISKFHGCYNITEL